jgi:hypothetical protein
MQRHKDAIMIQGGACNLRAIAATLVKAIDEVRAEGGVDCEDSAVRLIIHQMCFLASASDEAFVNYMKAMEECEEKAEEGAILSHREEGV